MPPVNDNLADATQLTGAEGSITGDTLDDSTYEADEPNVRNIGAQDASTWYVWECPADGALWINVVGSHDASGSDIDTYITLYSADTATPAMADLVYETEDDDYNLPSGDSTLNSGIDEYPVTAGRFYFLQVQSYSGLDPGSVIDVAWSMTGVPGGGGGGGPTTPAAGSISYSEASVGRRAGHTDFLAGCPLSDTEFALAWVTANTLYAAIATISLAGDIITYGTAVAVMTAPSTGFADPRLTRVDDTRFLLAVSVEMGDSDHGEGRVFIGQSDGAGGLTMGAPVTLTGPNDPATGTPRVDNIYAIGLTPTTAAVLWTDMGASPGYQYAAVATLDGTTITMPSSPWGWTQGGFSNITLYTQPNSWTFLRATDNSIWVNRYPGSVAEMTFHGTAEPTFAAGYVHTNSGTYTSMAVDPTDGSLIVDTATGFSSPVGGLTRLPLGATSDAPFVTTAGAPANHESVIAMASAVDATGTLAQVYWDHTTDDLRLDATDLAQAAADGSLQDWNFVGLTVTTSHSAEPTAYLYQGVVIPMPITVEGRHRFAVVVSFNDGSLDGLRAGVLSVEWATTPTPPPVDQVGWFIGTIGF